MITDRVALIQNKGWLRHRGIFNIGLAQVPEADGVHMAASDSDTAHTIELMMGDIRIKISNSVNPGLLTLIFQLLKAQSC